MAIQSRVVRTVTWLRDPTRRIKVLFISVFVTVSGVILASTFGGFLPYVFIGLGVLVLIILATSYIPGDTPLTHAEPVNATASPQPPYPQSTAPPQPYPPGAASYQPYPPSTASPYPPRTLLPYPPSSQNALPAVEGYPPPDDGYASQQAVQLPVALNLTLSQVGYHEQPDIPPPSYEEAMKPKT